MAKPADPSGIASRFAEAYCAIEGGGSTEGSGNSVESGGAAGRPGSVATHCALCRALSAPSRPLGLAVSNVSPFFGGFSSTAGVNGCSLASASAALSATPRIGLCCSAWAIRSAIASLPALRNHSLARASSPFCDSASPR